ncbi:MAG: hypothetical protein F6K21_02905 [Symploca sp. SIO2D2]|nr:hypothetical protein [Symploca sp. SIO2D2]
MKDSQTKITTTEVSLPKGGGAIQGIGETFQANEFTGTAALSIPIPTSPCRGFEPQLSVEYSSGSGNGTFGLGWSLAIPNISRKTSKAIPKYDDTDTFLISNAEDLVFQKEEPRTVNGIEYRVITYRPRVEGLFAKIERWLNQETGDCYWRTVSKDNVTSIFGKTEQARIFDPDSPRRVFQWLLEETFDSKGNYVVYRYKSENTDNVPLVIYEKNHLQTANKYLERIQYGSDSPLSEGQDIKSVNWHFEVVFDYGEYNINPSNSNPYTPVRKWESRPDPFSTFNAGFEIRTHRLCRNILMFHRFKTTDILRESEDEQEVEVLVHATQFEYQKTPTVSLLQSVQSTGYRYEEGEYVTKSLPPVEYGYTAFAPDDSQFQPLVQESDRELPGLNLPPDYQSIDLYGEGIPGVLYSDGKTTLYWEPQGEQPGEGKKVWDQEADAGTRGRGDAGTRRVETPPHISFTPEEPTPNPSQEGNNQPLTPPRRGIGTVNYGSPKELESFPIERQLQDGNRILTDLAGDGRMALVVSTSGYSGYYQYDPDRDSWESWQPFESFPTDFQNPDNQMVDVTGDGLADILLVDRDRLRIYQNQGEKGYGDPLTRPRENDVPMPKQGDVEEVLRFADIFGTGKQHLVRITNDMVEYWPNLGYGRFGKKVQLADAPHFGKRLDASRLFLVDIDGSGTADIAYVYSDCAPRTGKANRITIWFNQSGNSFSQPQTVTLPSAWDNLNQINFADILGNGTTGLVFSENHPQPCHWYYDFCDRKKPYLLNQVRNNLGAETEITYASSTKFYLQDKQQGTPWVTKLPFPVQVVEKVVNCDRISQTTLVSCYSYHHGYYDRTEKEFRGFGRVERQDAETLSVDDEPTKVPPVLSKTWYHTGAWLEHCSLCQQYQQEYFPGDDCAAPPLEPIFDWGEHEPSTEEERQVHVALKGTVLRTEVYGLDRSELEKNPYSVSDTGYNVKLLQPQGDNKYAVFYVWQRESLSYDYERNPQDPRIGHHFTIKVDDYSNVLQDCAIAYGRRTDQGIPEQNGLKATCTENSFINRAERDVWLLGVPVESKNYELINIALPSGEDYFDFEAISFILKNRGKANYNLLDWTQHFYWNEDLQNISDLGEVSPQMLLARSKVAVFSDGDIKSIFSEILEETDLENYLNNGKYNREHDYWWNPGLIQHYLGKDDFYLPANTIDPFNNETKVKYDDYHLLVKKVTDAIRNETEVEEIDYQTLQPQKIRDLNDNYSEVRFDALGMVVLSSHYGTENEQEVGFGKDLHLLNLPEFNIEDAIANPQTYLQGAASYFHYDLLAWNGQQTPAYAVNLVAEDYPTNARVQIHITYSDGFGREVQSKMRVEPGMAFSVQCDGSVEEIESEDRWLSSGGKVYNNKGNPVRVYEPYYINTHEYIDHPTLNEFGVSSVLHYDPLERVIRVDTPKGFFTKVEFTPWEEKHYDENDTVEDSPYYQNHIDEGGNCDLDPAECQALKKAAKFYNTPDIKILDNLGRMVRDVQQLEDTTRLPTYYELDIIGNQLSSADPRLSEKGIKNFETTYDLTNTALKTVSVDGGTHWTLPNVMGNPIYVQDSRKFEVTTEYDDLHRPIEVRVKGGDEVSLDNIVECIVYGEGISDAKNRNLRGQVYQHYDQAGLVTIEGYSINGQPLVSKRQLRRDYKQEANWNQTEKEAVEKEDSYETRAKYDALGRVIEETDADGNLHYPIYNLAGSLAQLQVTHAGEGSKTTYVSSIEYNPKGQRTKIVYGNGVSTSYEYEATTFRLTRILTKRGNGEGRILQDLNYTYDPVGNITQIKDDAWETIFNNNQRIDPVSKYTYDAIYRLTKATGREHPALSGLQERCADIPVNRLVSLPDLNNMEAVENYIRCYSYDKGGNLYRIRHCGYTPRTRKLTVWPTSNRAVDSKLVNGRTDIDAFFDANGNQIKMVNIRRVQWNYRDNIASATIIERKCGENDAEYYVYDSSGSRIRKVTERYGEKVTHVEEVIYLGGVEIRRTLQGSELKEERHCLRVMDDTTCIAVRNRWTVGEPPKGVQNPQVRYQLENHLGSATMEVDGEGQIISYEEYFPYGETVFVAGQSVAEVKLKHYRYSGKERDGSTGLYYYGARYYAPWLGRWLSCDPAGTVDGLNLYGFVRGNPILLRDVGGRNSTSFWSDPWGWIRTTHIYRWWYSNVDNVSTPYPESQSREEKKQQKKQRQRDKREQQEKQKQQMQPKKLVNSAPLPSSPAFSSLRPSSDLESSTSTDSDNLGSWNSVNNSQKRPRFNSIDSRLPGGRLRASEQAGGHLKAKHIVGQKELIQRLKKEPNIDTASTFENRSTAAKFVGDVLEGNQGKIKSFLDDTEKTELTISKDFDQSTGEIIKRSPDFNKKVTNKHPVKPSAGNQVVVVLHKSQHPALQDKGYRVHTAYPRIRR